MLTSIGAMRLAIEESKKGLGHVAPNPPVGCVILDKNGDFLAKGYHAVYGGDHAEIAAIKKIEDQSRLTDATIYVTLEPCAHEGKTPSCAKTLAQLPIKKIVYGLCDPNPLVNGAGARILSNAGIEVEQFSGLESELQESCEIFLWNMRKNQTFVALKCATSLDGQMAHASGESRWITNEESRLYAHYIRAQYDAVLVGSQTLLRDNPFLNIRHGYFKNKTNKVIVLDTHGRTLQQIKSLNVAQCRNIENVIVATGATHQPPAISGAPIAVPCAVDNSGQIMLTDLLEKIFSLGIKSILVEGGPEVISSFLQQQLANRYYQFIAPTIIGSKSGMNLSKKVDIQNWENRIVLKNVKTLNFGTDVLYTGLL